MNYIMFSGKVASVNAYTDGSYKVIDELACSWTVTQDYYKCTLVNEEWGNTSWIKAVFPKKIWNGFFETHKPETIKLLGVEGELKTEIGLGSGYVSNYIEVTKIAIYLTK